MTERQRLVMAGTIAVLGLALAVVFLCMAVAKGSVLTAVIEAACVVWFAARIVWRIRRA